jgi:hypothetical protein
VELSEPKPKPTELVVTPATSPISISSYSPSLSPSPSPATIVKNVQTSFERMAEIQLKMLQNIHELRPVLMQSKDTLDQIKKYAMTQPSPSPSTTPAMVRI